MLIAELGFLSRGPGLNLGDLGPRAGSHAWEAAGSGKDDIHKISMPLRQNSKSTSCNKPQSQAWQILTTSNLQPTTKLWLEIHPRQTRTGTRITRFQEYSGMLPESKTQPDARESEINAASDGSSDMFEQAQQFSLGQHYYLGFRVTTATT